MANALDAASEEMQEELASDRIFSDKERVGLPPGELVDLLQDGIEEGTFCEQSKPEAPCPIACHFADSACQAVACPAPFDPALPGLFCFRHPRV